MRKIRIYFNHKPWGRANSFIKSLHSALQKMEQVEFAKDIEDDYDVLFLDEFKVGGHANPLAENFPKRLRQYMRIRAEAASKKKIVVRAVNLRQHSHRLGFLYWFRDAAKIKLVNLADMVIFQSHYQKDFFVKYGYEGRNDVVIHNGADTSIFGDSEDIVWDGKEKLKIVSSSISIHPIKRHDIVAKVSECKDVEVSYMGYWPSSVDKKNVKLLGVLERKEVADILKHSHIFLHPAIKDSCPNVVFEAICCGLPVIYNDSIGSSAEIVKENGLPINEKSVEETIQQVKDSYYKLKENIKHTRNYYSINRVANQYTNVFSEVLDS